ncbi:MAG: hypothetical protein V2B20_15575 [Pseudomonadota bacterium]
MLIYTETKSEELRKELHRQKFFSRCLREDILLASIELEMTIGTHRGDVIGTGSLSPSNFFFEQIVRKIIVDTGKSRSVTFEFSSPIEAIRTGSGQKFFSDSG